MNVANYDNYMLINSYLTFCFLLFSVTALLQLGVNKVTGSDGILVRQLKETLTMLFNKSLRLDIFPETGNSRILYPFF